MNSPQHKIYFKSSENMSEVKNGVIKTIITSPPYWNLKNYLNEGQIGYKETYNKYLLRLEKVWEECFRVLKKDGSIWININTRVYKKIPHVIPYDIIKSMEKVGFFYKNCFMWHKPSGIPAPPNNLSDHFEYVLFFTKSKKDFRFNNEILWDDDYGLLNKGELGNSWRIVKKAGSIGKKIIHPAIYPKELVRRIILLSSIKNDIILDPFLGSGTTLIVSKELQRGSIGYELNNQEYRKLIELRIGENLDNINFYA